MDDDVADCRVAMLLNMGWRLMVGARYLVGHVVGARPCGLFEADTADLELHGG